MELDEFVEKFIEAVDFPEPVPIDGDSVIVELKFWDSLAQLGVIVMADMEFGLTLTSDDIAKCKSVQDLFLFCKSGG